jgi:N-dimethylarginine dimethylaminohydrolase
MLAEFGIRSVTETLRRVLVRRPDEAFAVDDPAAWNYAGRPDLEAARAEHDVLAAVLERRGAEVLYHDEPQPGRADAIYVFDPVLMTEHGAVVLRPAKPLRRGEEDALARRLEALGVPVIGRLHGEARAEGGDLLRLDPHTLAAGLGFRTNEAGVRQLRDLLSLRGVDVVSFDLPCHQGPKACLHLLSLVSLLADDLAVVFSPLMPVRFRRALEERGIALVEAPVEELATQATNVLALAPRVGLMLEGNPETRRRLERAGCDILTYRGREISFKAEGGPTCLTLPILRGLAPADAGRT